MNLYEFSLTRSIRAQWMLNELGVSYNSVPVNLKEAEHLKPEFKKINPYGKLPALEDGTFRIFESAAICSYLGDKYPEANLIPKAGTHDRGHYDQWMFFAMSELDASLWIIAKHEFIYPEDKRSKVAQELAAADFKKAAAVIDQHLATNQYMVGNQFTGADILVGHCMIWAKGYDMTKPYHLLEGFKNIEAYLGRLKDRKAMPEMLRGKA